MVSQWHNFTIWIHNAAEKEEGVGLTKTVRAVAFSQFGGINQHLMKIIVNLDPKGRAFEVQRLSERIQLSCALCLS